jgi:hypothetical protein
MMDLFTDEVIIRIVILISGLIIGLALPRR